MLVALLLMAEPCLSAGLPELPPASEGPWHLQGRGEARLLGLHLYDASLWVGEGGYRQDRAFVLVLIYARDFAHDTLVERSISEMRRLGSADEPRLLRWRAALEQILPDVASGDSLIGVSRPGGGAAFYHQGRLRGEIADPAFAQAFFAIWLDPRTRVPALRVQLLGSKAS